MMIIFHTGTFGRAFTNSDLLSFIIGFHGKDPKDFEFSVPANRENKWLETAIYNLVQISINEGRSSENNYFFKVTKIEHELNADTNRYIVSGIGEQERLLQNSIAIYDMPYNSKETGRAYMERVLETFTNTTWTIKGIYDSKAINFPPIKKGQYLSKWFWENFKKMKLLCSFERFESGSGITFFSQNVPEERKKIIKDYVSYDKVWENYFNAAYGLGNDRLFRYGNAKEPLYSNDIVSGTFTKTPITLKPTLPTDSYYRISEQFKDLMNAVFRFESVDSTDGYVATHPVIYTYEHIQDGPLAPNVSIYVLVTGYKHKKTGHTAIIPMININSEDMAKALKVVRIDMLPGYAEPPIAELPYTIKDGRFVYPDWPQGRSPSDRYQYGVLIGERHIKGLPHYPEESEISDPAFLALMALSGKNVYFPDGSPKTDYEMTEETFKNLDLGDEVISFYANPVLVTDKVISYENGEVHYDCTTKDIIDLDTDR